VATGSAALAKSGKFGDLKRRLWFLLLALVVYRIGAHIPVPGIDPDQLASLFKGQQGGILGMFNMFSGGALRRFTVFALGIMPYISASIISTRAGSPSGWRPSRRWASRWRSSRSRGS
jgi:preprotein translocase subunit SecY